MSGVRGTIPKMPRLLPAAVALCLTGILASGCGAGRVDFFLQGANYQAVVDAVRGYDLSPGVDHSFRVDEPWRATTLRVTPEMKADRGAGVGMVWATKTVDGALTVVLQVSDLGHAGVDGYAFADEPFTITTDDDGYRWAEELPGYIDLVRSELDEHWWVVYFDLD